MNEAPVPSSLLVADPEGNHTYARYGQFVKVKCEGQYECRFCGVHNWSRECQDLVLGKILTIVDASIINPAQNTSLKDLIRQSVYPAFRDLEDSLGLMFAKKLT